MVAKGQPKWWPSQGNEPDARWSLANERTLLAYSRTGLAFIVAGLAVAGSRQIAGTSFWFGGLGVPLILVGGVVGWSGRRRFLVAQEAMRTGQPLGAPVVAAVLPVVVGLVAVAASVVAVLEVVD